MTNKPPGSDIRNLWQTQPTEPLTMSIQQIRHKAEKFERNINFRNVVETIAAVCAMACADLLRRVWSWYLGPLLPGAALLYLGVLMQRPDKALDIGLNGLVFALIFLAIGALNLYATKKLQEEVDELDSLKNGESS